ncbi:hypothetical protein FB446DRAFT_646381 [Lentinula raphanica]|nr:hypothetical protein FB446DRAFT_646381 [Lentinula raphanica]
MPSNKLPNGASNENNTQSQHASSSTQLHDVLIATGLSEARAEESNQELSESDLAGLLKQIDGANGVLNGVEDRLDGILSNLDSLLAVLESAGTQSNGGGVTDGPDSAVGSGDAKERKVAGD